MKSLLVLLLLTLVQTNSGVQNPAAHLDGIVVKIGTGIPVTQARIELRRLEGTPAVAMGTVTDGSGRFAFENLPPGRYRLAAERDGYERVEYGERVPGVPGAPIVIAANQEIRDVLLQMIPNGAIAGRIVDKYGEPVVNAVVHAEAFSYEDGRRVLREVQFAKTNDRGEYRLFWLRPGKYIISVTGTNYAVPGPSSQSVQIGPPGPGQERIPLGVPSAWG